MYILIVDDDKYGNTLVQFVLAQEGYEVEAMENPREAWRMIQKREPDLLLLDVTMPYMDGFHFAERLHSEEFDFPIIFLTGQDSIEAKLRGFTIGADDYICKPFNHQELVARVQAVARRMKRLERIEGPSIRSGEVELFPAELKVAIDGYEPIFLTPKEMQVLRVLMNSAGHVVERYQLLSEVWNEEENNSNIVDVYIKRLRGKLEHNQLQPQRILSIRGVGYKFIGK